MPDIYAGTICDYARRCFAYDVWMPTDPTNILSPLTTVRVCEYFVDPDSDVYEGNIYGTQPFNIYPANAISPGLWTGVTKPRWIAGSLEAAINACASHRSFSGEYTSEYTNEYDKVREL